MAHHTDIIRSGYDAIAHVYEDYRSGLAGTRFLEKLHAKLKPTADILDIGCGSGVVVDDYFIRKGYLVTGLDISSGQVAIARKRFPRGNFLVRDMNTLQPGEFTVDAVVAFYSLFHIPRSDHKKMLTIWASFLPSGGWLLVTMGDRDFEGMHELLGEQMWSSHFGWEKNREIVEQAGFRVVENEMDDSGNEKHYLILAQKK